MLATIYETNWPELRNTLISDGNKGNVLSVIKDSVIGSNRQKNLLIENGLVRIILEMFVQNEQCEENDKLDALIILGSLANGSHEQVMTLVDEYDLVSIMLKEICSTKNNPKCIELCLATLRSIFDLPLIPTEQFFNEESSLSFLMSLAHPESSLRTQISVTCILVSMCTTFDDQILLLHAQTIQHLARMICHENANLQIPALRCLSCMCYKNRPVTDNVCVTSFQGKSLPDILTSLLSRLCHPEIQLSAAKCLSYIYRSGTLLATDIRILHKTLPCLARLCSESYDISIRASAAETLAYLIEVDSDLQRIAAISNNLLKSLSDLLQHSEAHPKASALKCYASLAANDESIRKRIMESLGLIISVLEGLNNEAHEDVKLASIKVLQSLSRSVQLLRTTFQDNCVWKPLITVLKSTPSVEFQIAVTSTMCNLMLEFSPSKEPLINAGIIEEICHLADHSNPHLRLNCIWALMNMSFQAEQRVKTDIINTLGIKKVLDLLWDFDAEIAMKSLGLLRNLFSKSHHIDMVMLTNSAQILTAFNMLLESTRSADIKEQVLIIVGNIAAEAKGGNYILNDDKIMTKLNEFMFHSDPKIQSGALYALSHIVLCREGWSKARFQRLEELNIIQKLSELNKTVVRTKAISCDDYIYRTLKEIVIQCKQFCPEHFK